MDDKYKEFRRKNQLGEFKHRNITSIRDTFDRFIYLCGLFFFVCLLIGIGSGIGFLIFK